MMTNRASFTLTGKTPAFDQRIEAVRGDLADISLAGKLFAPHYAEAVETVCARPFTALCESPNGPQSSELLSGEVFMLLDVSGGWAWGWCAHDHYVGYVEAAALDHAAPKSTWSVANDHVAAAEAFLGEPYVWGGRGGAGIDCSGLVQRGLSAIGISAPRDSDMQRDALGILLEDGAPRRRGDLIFFPGHVGIKYAQDELLHATRHHGRTVIEPLSEVVERVKAKNNGIGIIACRRVIV
jgi:cell wall-associated NlpC family hydrolase